MAANDEVLRKHLDDDGNLSLFINDDGSFAIVCDKGHAWHGSWKGVLKAYKSDSATTVVEALIESDSMEWLDQAIVAAQ